MRSHNSVTRIQTAFRTLCCRLKALLESDELVAVLVTLPGVECGSSGSFGINGEFSFPFGAADMLQDF